MCKHEFVAERPPCVETVLGVRVDEVGEGEGPGLHHAFGLSSSHGRSTVSTHARAALRVAKVVQRVRLALRTSAG